MANQKPQKKSSNNISVLILAPFSIPAFIYLIENKLNLYTILLAILLSTLIYLIHILLRDVFSIVVIKEDKITIANDIDFKWEDVKRLKKLFFNIYKIEFLNSDESFLFVLRDFVPRLFGEKLWDSKADKIIERNHRKYRFRMD